MAYSPVAIAGIVAMYFTVSISLVFVNKMLMSGGASIEAPLFVTWFQCVVSLGIAVVTGWMGKASPEGSFWRQFPEYEYKLPVARKTIHMACIFVGMIALNNLCLKYVEVSFYQVARSLTIVFNVLFTYLVLQTKTSSTTLCTLAVVILGFYMGSSGEVHFSMLGTSFGVMSSVFVAMNSIATKTALTAVDGNKFKLSGYVNTTACVLFLPLILIGGEVDVLRQSSELLLSGSFWLLMMIGGVGGFLIGIVCMLQIQATSPLTHNISGTAKACLQTVLALAYYQNPTTASNLMGIMLVLMGSLAYAYVRTQEMRNTKPAPPVADAVKPEETEALAGKTMDMSPERASSSV